MRYPWRSRTSCFSGSISSRHDPLWLKGFPRAVGFDSGPRPRRHRDQTETCLNDEVAAGFLSSIKGVAAHSGFGIGMDEGRWRRRVDNWDRFLERWYAPLVVFFGSVALSFSVTLVYVGAFDSVGLTLSRGGEHLHRFCSAQPKGRSDPWTPLVNDVPDW